MKIKQDKLKYNELVEAGLWLDLSDEFDFRVCLHLPGIAGCIYQTC